MITNRIKGGLLSLLAHLSACSGTASPAEPPTAPRVEETATLAPLESTAEPKPVALVSILDPELLLSLEARGFGVGMLVEGREARTTAELSAMPGHGSILRTLQRDIADVLRRYPDARVSSVQGTRLFDTMFLNSESMSFTLSGVFNRLDRRAFSDQGCGEVRFLYRLGYNIEQGAEPMVARLPMTLNVVFDVAGDDCSEVAAQWLVPSELRGEEMLTWLLSGGALGADAQQGWTLRAVETNMQTVRFQSTMHPKMAGHIEYVLRVFHPVDGKSDRFSPAPLENTPNVQALRRDKALRSELLAYLRRPEVLERIDLGILSLSEMFLARRATSVSPRGLARLANRPFKQLFSIDDFEELDLSSYRSIQSPAALLRRLDVASCQGCHQSRSIAGFHHVGDEPDPQHTFNALFKGASPHLLGDLARRRRYVSEVAAGDAPGEFRPFPERQGVPEGVGAPCGLGDSGFANWECPAGLRCALIEDSEVGLCHGDIGGVGDACQYGTMKSGRKPLRDRIQNLKTHRCDLGQDSCFENVAGASQGMCVGSCDDVTAPGSICGDFLDIDGFQRCLRRQNSYASCATTFVYPLALQECDETHACRSDYVCTKTGIDEPGACVPSYFIMQLRTDGYPFRR